MLHAYELSGGLHAYTVATCEVPILRPQLEYTTCKKTAAWNSIEHRFFSSCVVWFGRFGLGCFLVCLLGWLGLFFCCLGLLLPQP